MGISPHIGAAQAPGQFQCAVTENGAPASGTMTLRRENGPEVASTACGQALSAAPGRYVAVIHLDGALDGPLSRHTVVIKSGEVARVVADFATAILEVRIESGGRRVAGMAVIYKGGRQIGTLGSGVAAHISAGTYEVVTRYRTLEKRFDNVRLSPGERRELVSSF